MDKLKSIKIKNSDGTYTDEIPVGVSAENVDYNDTKTLKQILGNLDITKGTVEERLNFSEMKSISYDDLKALKDGGKLVPGQSYRIIDYVCTITQEEFRVVDHPFDIIVWADDASTLNENARACKREGDEYYVNCNLTAWELKYCLDNDTSRFAWASELGHGVVYYLKDDHNNECPYDFKQIQFMRYKITACTVSSLVGKYTSLLYGNAITGIDKQNPVWCYTFSYDPESTGIMSDASVMEFNADNNVDVSGNVIKAFHSYQNSDEDTALQIAALNSIVFFGNVCKFNTFGNNGYFNTFGNNCLSNTFGDNFLTNVFGDNCQFNIFGNNCHSNTFGDGYLSNVFGNFCASNTFEDNCSSNRFGNGCTSNMFNSTCSANTFGKNCSENVFRTNCKDVSIGNNCSGNVFGNDCLKITMGHSCNSNTFGDYCSNSVFAGNNSNNILGNICDQIVFGLGCSRNVLGENCIIIRFENNCYENNLSDYCTEIVLEENCYKNTFGQSCEKNKLKLSCYENGFGNTCFGNELGSYSFKNTFGDKCNNNMFLQNCTSNTFASGCSANYFSMGCGRNTFDVRCSSNKLLYSMTNGNKLFSGITNETDAVRHYTFLARVRNQTIQGILNANSSIYVGLSTDGQLKTWNPADLVPAEENQPTTEG